MKNFIRKKKNTLKILFHICMGICALLLVMASMLWTQIPNFVTIVMCVVLLVSFLWCFRTAVRKRVAKAGLTIFTLFMIFVSLFGNYCNPYWNSISFKRNAGYGSEAGDMVLTQKEAKEDLEYAMYYLKKIHPALKNGMPDEIAEQYEKVLTELEQTDEVSVYELSRKIESIFSLLQDAHTLAWAGVLEPHYLKDMDAWTQEGKAIVAVNGISVQDLMEQKKDLYSFETEKREIRLLRSDLCSLEGLGYLGFSPEEGITYTLETKDGIREDDTYSEKDFLPYDVYMAGNQTEEPFVSYEIDDKNSVAILTLNSCQYNEEYKNCLKEMFAKVKEKKIQNVVVDLRENGGGNAQVAYEFIRYLDVDRYNQGENDFRLGCFNFHSDYTNMENKKYSELLFDGKVYVLTSEKTFSSAMLFAQYISDNKLGTLIGEAPANMPNGYGNIASFKLPHSKILMQISTMKFERVDSSKSDELVEPDIACNSEDAMDVLYQSITDLSD